jgi:hypothetical protein
VNGYIQEGMINTLWSKVEFLLGEDENIWEDLTNEDAWEYVKDAQLKLRIKQKNRRRKTPAAKKTAEPAPKDKKDRENKQKAAATIAAKAASPSGAPAPGEDRPRRQALWDGNPLAEFKTGSIDMICKHFLNDSCHAGENCPFTHSEAAKAKASKEAAKTDGDKVPEEGFKGLAVPQKTAQLGLKKTVRFNPNLVLTLVRHSDVAGTSDSEVIQAVGSLKELALVLVILK